MSSDPDSTQSQKPQSTKESFTGSCMCGKLTYSVELTLATPPKAVRCNCTKCQKSGYDSIMVKPADFHLKTPCTTDECIDKNNTHGKLLGVYTLEKTSPDLHRYFCDACGVCVFIAGQYPYSGQTIDYFSVNGKTIDQPQNGLDLSQIKFDYYDGLNDAFDKGPRDQPYPHGSR